MQPAWSPRASEAIFGEHRDVRPLAPVLTMSTCLADFNSDDPDDPETTSQSSANTPLQDSDSSPQPVKVASSNNRKRGSSPYCPFKPKPSPLPAKVGNSPTPLRGERLPANKIAASPLKPGRERSQPRKQNPPPAGKVDVLPRAGKVENQFQVSNGVKSPQAERVAKSPPADPVAPTPQANQTKNPPQVIKTEKSPDVVNVEKPPAVKAERPPQVAKVEPGRTLSCDFGALPLSLASSKEQGPQRPHKHRICPTFRF